MQPEPFFSVIIPTYNRAHRLVATIQTVLHQEGPVYELIIVDDGSTDETEAVVAGINDERVCYIKTSNKERGAARNAGIIKAKGRYITFLDSDDLLYAGHLQYAAECLSAQGYPEWFHSRFEVVNDLGKKLYEQPEIKRKSNKKLLSGNFLSCQGVFLRKDIALAHSFSENRTLSGSEDWELWLRLAARYPLLYSNKITSCQVTHSGRSVLKSDEKEIQERTRVLVEELENDPVFKAKYGQKGLKRIKAHMLSYLALHLVMSGRKKGVLGYLWRAGLLSPEEWFSRRFLAILHKVMIR